MSFQATHWQLTVILLTLAFLLGCSERVSDVVVPATLCELLTNAQAFDHKLVKVSGEASREFENFTLSDQECHAPWPNRVWLEYGGTVSSGTQFCCPGSPGRTRPTPLEVDGIVTTLVADDVFDRFDRLIQRIPKGNARLTLVGRFFAGRRIEDPRAKRWGGYGHFGEFTLLVVQQVVSVDE